MHIEITARRKLFCVQYQEPTCYRWFEVKLPAEEHLQTFHTLQ